MKTRTSEQLEAIKELRKMLRPGMMVYTVLRHVSSSGMCRWIDLYIHKKNQPVRLTWTAARALGWTYDPRHEALKVGGCGMDMGFHAVYSLGYVLFPKGFKLPKGKLGRNGDTSGHDNDGGYALNHRWM